jgi:hypothetical protein
MSYQIGTATDYSDLLDQLDTFLTGAGTTLRPSYAGTGNGVISGLVGGSASVAETVTITFTDATHFDVVGSVTGAIGSGVTGTPFTSTKINFSIAVGGTAFIAGDVFTVTTVPPWVSKRRSSGSEMIWQAPGNGGTDQIFVGAKLFHDLGGDYYNWRLGGFTAFDSGLDFFHQANYVGGPGQSLPSPVLNLWNSSIPYWFVANGRRVIVVAKVSSVYVVAYLGFINAYVAPGAFPYPIAVGGSMTWDGALSSEPAVGDVRWRWSYVGNELRNLGLGQTTKSADNGEQLRLRLPSGLWRGFGSSWTETQFGRIWPWSDFNNSGGQDWRDNLDGGYTVLPVVLHEGDRTNPNVWGEPDGIGAITGFGQSSENTISFGLALWLVVQNVNRNTKVDYFAVQLQ